LFTADIGSARFPEARDIFYGCGAQYFATVCVEITAHIKNWGLKYKPSAST
jgi:hypothetical protein